MDFYFFELGYFLVTLLITFFFLKRGNVFKDNRKKLFINWVIFGFIINLFGLSWLYTVYPLTWIQEGLLQTFGIFTLHIIMSFFVSLPYGLISLSYRKTNIHFTPFLFSVSITIAEILRSIILSLIFLGENTSIGLHFTAGVIGNALSITPLIEFAYFGGTFALTFIFCYLTYIFYNKIFLRKYLSHIFIMLIILIMIHYLIPVHKLDNGTKVGIVTTNVILNNQNIKDFKKTAQDNKLWLYNNTLSFNEDTSIIVYPEDTRLLSRLNKDEINNIYNHFKTNITLIDGDTLSKESKLFNASVFLNKEEAGLLGRGKEFLLPFSEYIPFVFYKLFSFFIDKNLMEDYKKNHTYTPIYSEKVFIYNNFKIGTIICSEILSFSIIENIKKEKPDIIFFQSQLSVFHNNPIFIMHLRSFSKILGAQTRTYVISSSNNAPSLIISPYGRIEKYIDTGFSTSTYDF